VAYITANGTDTAGAVAYPPSAGQLPESKQDAVLRRAERTVREVAPPASGDEYRRAAADAELAAFEFLAENPDYLKNYSVLDESTSLAGRGELVEMVAQMMGSFTDERLRFTGGVAQGYVTEISY
jgi:hypothetical protein